MMLNRVKSWTMAWGPWLVMAIFAVGAYVEHDARGLSNPLRSGKNVRIFATVAPQRVPAAGTNCAVTFVNDNAEHLCTGFGTLLANGKMADGGVTCDTSLDVCNVAPCLNNWLTRDAVPDALWFMIPPPAPADGGIWGRLEMSAGCQTP